MQADNRAIQAAGAMPLNVLTATTLQTPDGLLASQLSDASEVERQVTALLAAYPVGAIKIGMLGHASIVEAVARALQAQRITYGRRATCRRTCKLAMSLPPLLTTPQL